MSVFLAIDLDPPVRSELTQLLTTHRAKVHAKWLSPEKLHATLVFLGNPSPEAMDDLSAQCEVLARAHRPFLLHLEGSGTFETRRAAAVLWLGIGGDLQLLHGLRQHVCAALEPSAPPFVPHVTLGRAQLHGAFDGTREALSTFRSATFEVDGLVLYESTHHHYRAISRHAFPRAQEP